MSEENKFPSEIIDLPSEGKLYSKEHPCSNGKIEIKYMTAREEDILTSQNLIKKGVVIDMVLNSVILTPGVKCDDLILGDKNAVMVAARILAYGPEYECEVVDPNTGIKLTHTFNLAECPFRKLPKDVKTNEFEFELPIAKKKVKYKILTGKEEQVILAELKADSKLGQQISRDITTRLRHTIASVEGEDSPGFINEFVNNMLARDSKALRSNIKSVSPDIVMEQAIEVGGETVEVNIPMTVNFFWPKS